MPRQGHAGEPILLPPLSLRLAPLRRRRQKVGHEAQRPQIRRRRPAPAAFPFPLLPLLLPPSTLLLLLPIDVPAACRRRRRLAPLLPRRLVAGCLFSFVQVNHALLSRAWIHHTQPPRRYTQKNTHRHIHHPRSRRRAEGKLRRALPALDPQDDVGPEGGQRRRQEFEAEAIYKDLCGVGWD